MIHTPSQNRTHVKPNSDQGDPNWKRAFSYLQDSEKYRTFGSNDIAVFASKLRLGFDDIETFAAEALTDSNNDKKCDLVYVNEDDGLIVLGQSYRTEDLFTPKREAKANKASDMNAAVSWLLSGNLEGAPTTLKSATETLRAAIHDHTIDRLELWYIHNLPESINVRDALETAAETAKGLLNTYYPEQAKRIRIVPVEMGRETIGELYETNDVPIAVTAPVEFSVDYGFPFEGENWRCFSTLVSAADLHSQWNRHKTSLLSPNVREYLGLKRDSSNVNYGIRQTMQEEPENFAIFNNGITVLTHGVSIGGVDLTSETLEDGTFEDALNQNGPLTLVAKGVGIINGGQTTGTIGELSKDMASNAARAKVMARFVISDDPDVLSKIVKFNNTQNKVEAADFRSTDKRQEDLRSEFETIPEAIYRGGRRGGDSDKILRTGKKETLLGDKEVVQSLAAFHGDPNLAYNQTTQIWEDNTTYAKIFSADLTARHIVFTFSLLKAVLSQRQRLKTTPTDDLTSLEKEARDFLSYRGSHILLVAAIGHSIETIIGAPVKNKALLTFKENLSPETAEGLWEPVVRGVLPIASEMTEAIRKGLKNKEAVGSALGAFSRTLGIAGGSNPAFKEFAEKVTENRLK